MRIEFDRDLLSKGLQRIGSVVERKSTMPILGNVLLDVANGQLTISATDLEIGIRSTCQVKVDDEGQVCVPARSFIEIVKELPEKKATMQKKENQWLGLESGKAQFRVVGVAAEEFPKMMGPEDFSFSKIRLETLLHLIEQTAFAISVDEMRYNLNGAYLEMGKGDKGPIMRMVSTDGHRLAMSEQILGKDEKISLKKGVILPRKGIAELRRLLQEAETEFVEVGFTDTNAAFRIDGTVIYMRLIVGEFPDYNAVIPKKNTNKLFMNAGLLAKSLRRVSLLSEGKTKCIRLGVGKKGVHVQANSPDIGEAEEDLQGEFEGKDLEIGFNARYLLDALSVVKDRNMVMELEHDQSPGILRIPDDPSYLAVIMPMRI